MPHVKPVRTETCGAIMREIYLYCCKRKVEDFSIITNHIACFEIQRLRRSPPLPPYTFHFIKTQTTRTNHGGTQHSDISSQRGITAACHFLLQSFYG